MKQKWTEKLMNDHGIAWFKMNESNGNIMDSKGSNIGTAIGLQYLGEEGIKFNGTSSSYVQFNNKVIPIGKKSIYFEIKKTNGLPTDINAIIECALSDSGTVVNGDSIRINPNGSIVWILYGGTNSVYTIHLAPIYNVCDGFWHKVLFTWDGTMNENSVKIYIDNLNNPIGVGTANGVETKPHSINTLLGKTANTSTYTRPFSGQLKNIQIYNELINPISDNHFIKPSNGKIYSFDLNSSSWINQNTIESNLTESDYLTNGIPQLELIPQQKWNELQKPIKILTFSKLDEDIILETEVEPFRPIDEIQKNGEFEVITYTESDKDIKLELTVPPYKPLYLLDNPKLLTWTESEEDLEIVQNITVEQKKRFLVSKDNRSTWQKFNHDTETWENADIHDIYTLGMTKEELESITRQQWRLWTELNMYLDFACSLEGANLEGNLHSPYITSFEVMFPENEAPLINNPKLTAGIYELDDETTIHAETINLNAELVDLEGDQLKYKILINGDKVFPENEEWTELLNSPFNLQKSFEYTYFNVANHYENNPPTEDLLENTVAIVVRDDRDVERTWTGKVLVINAKPMIVLSHTDFTLNATISDPDNDKLAYRILINNDAKYPTSNDNVIDGKRYTEFKNSPYDLSYQWRSTDLKFNRPNTITLEIIDALKGVTTSSFNVIGTYRGLMFVDDAGNYYTSDSGEILKYLDFNTIMAGQTTEPKIVYLRNQNGFDIEDTEVIVDLPTAPQGVEIKLSKLPDPYENKDDLSFSGILQDGEQVYFYAKLITDAFSTSGGGVFKINAKAKSIV